MPWEDVAEALVGNGPITDKYQALFMAQQCTPSTAVLLETLSQALLSERSVLMRHEIAYLMGQIGDVMAVPELRRLLHSTEEDEVTRHEAAEGLAAIDPEKCIQDFERYTAGGEGTHLLAQTCELALEAIKRKDEPGALPACVCQQFDKVTSAAGSVKYLSTDPAEGYPGATPEHIPQLAEELQNEVLPLYKRYQAMFTLRNLDCAEAVARLCDSLVQDQGSPCFRHEVAFVLGQLESKVAVQALLKKLAARDEHAVVRHEAAIALGSIGGVEVEETLQVHVADSEPMVAESCEVALSMIAYWKQWEDPE
eukprot:TRINITY_DN61192_c0_g1_i2.p1 TRINITY_DN61192_c0_g1~~TRINITY_DN61192_c0_g1_i2.p1  ORF type:complete len:310 (-),score=68.12 TRINITY_DN61192_c0_g1_i2:124-1053(-)